MKDLYFSKIRAALLLLVITLFINSWAVAQISGPDANLTPGVEYNYYVTPSNCSNYFWNVAGGTIVEQNATYVKIKWSNVSDGSLSFNRALNSCVPVSGSCPACDGLNDYLDVQIDYQPSLPPISGNEICCDQQSDYSFTAGTLFPDPDVTLSGGNGTYAYQWQKSSDGTSWVDILTGATSSSYSPGIVSNTTYYRRVVTSGSAVDNGSIITITISFDGPAVEGWNGTWSVCSPNSTFLCSNYKVFCNDVTTVYLGSNEIGGERCWSYTWQKSLDNINWVDLTSNSSSFYYAPVTDHTVYYRLKSHYSSGLTCWQSSHDLYTEPVKVRRFDEHERLKSGEYTGRYIFKGWQSVSNRHRPANNANVIVKSGANMKLRSMEEIQLLPPFSVEEGADFTAEIGELCQLGNWREGSEVNSELELELTLKNEIRIFPNPTDGLFHLLLNLPAEKLIKISVLNLQGREVKVIPKFVGQNVDKEIDLQNQNSGMYIVEVDIDGKIERHKIIVNK